MTRISIFDIYWIVVWNINHLYIYIYKRKMLVYLIFKNVMKRLFKFGSYKIHLSAYGHIMHYNTRYKNSKNRDF